MSTDGMFGTRGKNERREKKIIVKKNLLFTILYAVNFSTFSCQTKIYYYEANFSSLPFFFSKFQTKPNRPDHVI